MTTHDIDWQAIGKALRAPFDPREVDFRVQGKVSEKTGKAQVVCYIDARTVADRLDAVVGPGAWSFHYEPLLVERGEVQLAKGALTIHGITKEDVGDGSTFATSKGCVSDALKRAAVLWGVGRYLYDVDNTWVSVDGNGRIAEEVIAKLRARLPRPQDAAPVAPATPAVSLAPVPGVWPAVPPQPVVAPVPPEMAEAARQAAQATTAPAREPFRTATLQQWDTLRKLCTQVHRPEPEPPLSFDEAGALIATLSDEYKRMVAQRQRQGVAR